MIKAKKQRKTIEWERLEIFQKIWRYQGNISGKNGHNKEQNGKTRDLFKKIRDTKGTFHEKMGLIKDRNGMDLTEAEEVARIHRGTVQKRSS